MRSLRSFTMRMVSALVALGSSLGAMAIVLDPPQLRCVSVLNITDARLSWIPTTDPTAEFLQYNIYSSPTAAGPYALLTSVPLLATTAWTGAGTGVELGPVYFYITSVSTSAVPNESVPSDTLASMFLEVAQSTPLGSANVNWNLPHVPPLASMDSIAIWLEYPIGTATLLDSLPSYQTFFQ